MRLTLLWEKKIHGGLAGSLPCRLLGWPWLASWPCMLVGCACSPSMEGDRRRGEGRRAGGLRGEAAGGGVHAQEGGAARRVSRLQA